nr:hypothetical protein Itr_chr05CG06430 [Ipomoea trifida]
MYYIPKCIFHEFETIISFFFLMLEAWSINFPMLAIMVIFTKFIYTVQCFPRYLAL